MSIVFDLLARVEAAGGTAEAQGEKLHLQAPEPLPADLMDALRDHKPKILEVLAILNFPLSEFEQGDCAIEIQVPWLDTPIWFCPTETEATVLVSEGMRRAQIWTVRELRDLMSVPGLDLEGVRSIQAVKDGFEGRVVEVRKTRATP